MKILTNEQIISIFTLRDRAPHLFWSTGLSNNSMGQQIDIFAKPNVDWRKCDDEIKEIFPKSLYIEENPSIFSNKDGTFSEHYNLKDISGVRIVLYMKKAPGQKEETPASTGAVREISLPEHTTNECVCEDIVVKREEKWPCFGKFVSGDIPCETSWCNAGEECLRVSEGVGAK